MSRLKLPPGWRSRDALSSLLLSKKLKAIVLGLSVYATAVAAQGFLHERGIPNLARADSAKRESLLRHWKQGDLVVLVRHVERCDHSEAPCLNVEKGITHRAVDVAVDLGKEFKELGLESTDLYTSPVTRAMQTSAFMFHAGVPQQDWLSQCREAFLDQIVRHKQAHRNLVLVTHSECVSQLEDSLALLDYRTPNYGESLFLTLDDSTRSLKVMGYLGAANWSKLSPAPDSK